MEKINAYKDLLHFETTLQKQFNDHMVQVRNPTARQLFSKLRDDDMGHIVVLQQLIESIEGAKEPVQIIPPEL